MPSGKTRGESPIPSHKPAQSIKSFEGRVILESDLQQYAKDFSHFDVLSLQP